MTTLKNAPETDVDECIEADTSESRPSEPPEAVTRDRLRQATETLEAIVVDHSALAALSKEDKDRLVEAAGRVWVPDLKARRRLVKAINARRRAERVEREEKVLEETGIRELRRKPTFTTPNYFLKPGSEQGGAQESQSSEADSKASLHCYICKRDYVGLHHFYDQMCRDCGDFNFAKRSELADLKGRVALVTGARVKIGYQAGLKLLRCGAHLIVSTRFPRDAALRYSKEPDFSEWSDRLEIFGLDLRHTPSVEMFCQELLTRGGRLDFIINNACQTVRRPPAFYEHMMELETAALDALGRDARRLVEGYESLRARLAQGLRRSLVEGSTPEISASPEAIGLVAAASLTQVPMLPDENAAQGPLFPPGRFDQDLQQVDLRKTNSWRMLLAEVPTVELLEVHLVNAVAPFLLNARLKPLMVAAPERDKHVVNVSAVEGQFYRNSKTTRHPHTNMAKASLNMMTRTSAADYHNDGIHMNSVDTGWVTDEDAEAIAVRKRERHRFHPPLDIVDGAARIVDPIIVGANTGEHVWGQFLKDYKQTDW